MLVCCFGYIRKQDLFLKSLKKTGFVPPARPRGQAVVRTDLTVRILFGA